MPGPTAQMSQMPVQAGPRAPESVVSPAPTRPGSQARRSARLRASTRLRLLVSYLVVLALAALAFVVLGREVLLLPIQGRADAELEQEALELERLLVDGRDPETGRPFDSLSALLTVYFSRNVPSLEEATVAYVGDRVHDSALDRYPLPELPAAAVDRWRAFVAAGPHGPPVERGTYGTRLGEGRYQVSRIDFQGETGAFAVTVLPAAQLRELRDLQTYGLLTFVLALLLATVCAWPLAGRILAPVGALARTARSISESDLTRRVPVTTTGEAADMARSFNAMLDRVEALVRDQREFVRDASHELRDPLTICRTQLELLGDDPRERAAGVSLVLDELTRMARIVGDLQVLAGARQPDFVRFEPVDPRGLVQELAVKASALGERRRVVVDDGIEGMVVGDRHRLTEAVMNLVHNAVQHTGPYEAIELGAARDGQEWRLWVSDAGVGIAREHQECIFERFVRGPGAHRRYQGSGLGLAIVRLVAEAHRGRVELRSAPGAGASFTLVLPVEPDCPAT